MNLKSAFWGYAKGDVQAMANEFKRRMREADRLSKEKDALLVDYQRQIEEYQQKESIINQALQDARTIASTILKKAEQEAQELMLSTEALTDQQLASSRADIKQLEQIRDKISKHEALMRDQLLKLIEEQRAVIESFDLSTFQEANQQILDHVAESEDIIQSSKIRVVLPSAVNQSQTEDRDAIPLYSLK